MEQSRAVAHHRGTESGSRRAAQHKSQQQNLHLPKQKLHLLTLARFFAGFAAMPARRRSLPAPPFACMVAACSLAERAAMVPTVHW